MIIPPSGSLAIGSPIGGAVSGLLKTTSGLLAAAVAGADYLAPAGSGAQLTGLVASQIGSVPAGILKGSAGAFAAATAGADYVLPTGVAGGQTIVGGTGGAQDLTLQSTSHATKGLILLGASSAYDGANIRLGIGTAAPTCPLDVRGGNLRVGNPTTDSQFQIACVNYMGAVQAGSQRTTYIQSNGSYGFDAFDYQAGAALNLTIGMSGQNVFFSPGGGNVAVGSTPASFGGGFRCLFLGDAGVPSSSPAGGGLAYAEAGVLKYRSSAGVIFDTTRQNVTGSRDGNAALASLLTAMAATGLILDSTTA